MDARSSSAMLGSTISTNEDSRHLLTVFTQALPFLGNLFFREFLAGFIKTVPSPPRDYGATGIKINGCAVVDDGARAMSAWSSSTRTDTNVLPRRSLQHRVGSILIDAQCR
jgi:hypothetical protein